MKEFFTVIVLVAVLALLIYVGIRSQEPTTIRSQEPTTIRIDGCQYIEIGVRGTHGYSITHKGDCDNPIHKR